MQGDNDHAADDPDRQAQEVLTRPSPPPAYTRGYGTATAQVYDVRLPPHQGPDLGATVLVVHGGFWRAGYDRLHVGSQAQAFADAGWHVAVGEYRRTGMPGGGVPGTLHDIRRLVTAVSRDTDLPGPLVAVGHSAGGHLLTWAANQPWAQGRPDAPRLAGVVSLGGCVDLRATAILGLGEGAAVAFVGERDLDAPAWRLADPVHSLPPGVPVRLLHGAADHVVPLAVTDRYLAAARERGADVTLEVVPGCGHYGLIDPQHPAFARVLSAARALLPPPSNV